jgi:Flp pilus assembly protein CpaB
MPRLPGCAWLLVAIGFTTLATYMALGWLKRQAAVQPPSKEKASLVVVAKIAIAPASLLSEVQLKTEVWHQEKPPQAPPAAAAVSPPALTVEMIRGLERAPVNSW